MRYFAVFLAVIYLLAGAVAPVRAQPVSYSFAISGLEENPDLTKEIKTKSLLIKLSDKKPMSLSALKRRVQNDMDVIIKIMKEQGYFNASLTQEISPAEGRDEKKIMISVQPGALYTISSIDFKWTEDPPPERVTLADISLPVGKPARPQSILESEQPVLNVLMKNGFPFPKIISRKLYVDHEAETISAVFEINPGPVATFGNLRIEGRNEIDEDFVRRRVDWKRGEKFSIEKVAKTRKRLTRTGVISRADITYGDLMGDGSLPIIIKISEGKRRTAGVGVAYSTTREILANIFWEHRNLFGDAERFRVKLEGGTTSYVLDTTLSIPDFLGDENLSWQNSLNLSREFFEAFDKTSAAANTSVTYRYSGNSSVSGGFGLERSRIEQDNVKDQTFTLISFPMNYRFDNTDDFLDPQDGMRFRAGLTPYQILNRQDTFAKTDTEFSHYFSMSESFVWANRARAAVIFGQNHQDIPVDKRLYAGGGGSVRGYGHQLLGPLDAEDDPVGGRAAFEIGTEGRYKFTPKIEGVTFLEGGRVSRDIEFDSGTDILWGAGAGLRYHTAIGPLRADIAVPLDKREPDDAFQIYLSIGQAF